MIVLTRPGGYSVAVNANQVALLEDAAPTRLTLLDGQVLVVTESLRQVVEKVTAFRAGVLLSTHELRCRHERPLAPVRHLPLRPEERVASARRARIRPGANRQRLDRV